MFNNHITKQVFYLVIYSVRIRWGHFFSLLITLLKLLLEFHVSLSLSLSLSLFYSHAKRNLRHLVNYSSVRRDSMAPDSSYEMVFTGAEAVPLPITNQTQAFYFPLVYTVMVKKSPDGSRYLPTPPHGQDMTQGRI